MGGIPSGSLADFVLSLINLRSTMLGVNNKSNVRGITSWWGGGRDWLSAINAELKYALSMFGFHSVCEDK